MAETVDKMKYLTNPDGSAVRDWKGDLIPLDAFGADPTYSTKYEEKSNDEIAEDMKNLGIPVPNDFGT